MPANTQTVKNRARVGFSELHIFPHVDGKNIASYDALTGSHLAGLKTLDVTDTSTTVTVTGGDILHPIESFEVSREGKYKGSVAKSSLKTLAILQGGRLIVVPAAGGSGEQQYFAPNKNEDAPYFFALAKSTRGNGVEVFVMCKCKITGAVSYNLNMDQVTNLEFEFMLHWDDTFTCQDGVVGGISERLWASDGNTTLHS